MTKNPEEAPVVWQSVRKKTPVSGTHEDRGGGVIVAVLVDTGKDEGLGEETCVAERKRKVREGAGPCSCFGGSRVRSPAVGLGRWEGSSRGFLWRMTSGGGDGEGGDGSMWKDLVPNSSRASAHDSLDCTVV